MDEKEKVLAFLGANHFIISNLVGEFTFSEKIKKEIKEKKINNYNDKRKVPLNLLSEFKKKKYKIIIMNEDVNLKENINLKYYSDFGLYIYSSDILNLFIRCGGSELTGHSHYDQLSIEINLFGKDFLTDPGTYLYSALPKKRNKYRSKKCHWTPQDEYDNNFDGSSIFTLPILPLGKCLFFSKKEFWGKGRNSRGSAIYRNVKINSRSIIISDYSRNIMKDMMPSKIIVSNNIRRLDKVNYSPGYGKLHYINNPVFN